MSCGAGSTRARWRFAVYIVAGQHVTRGENLNAISFAYRLDNPISKLEWTKIIKRTLNWIYF